MSVTRRQLLKTALLAPFALLAAKLFGTPKPPDSEIIRKLEMGRDFARKFTTEYFVLAGSYQQFRMWQGENPGVKGHYVHTWEQVAGMQFGEHRLFLLYGTYWMNPEHERIQELARINHRVSRVYGEKLS